MQANEPTQHTRPDSAFVRTVIGDLPAESLGACDAHEHIIINSPFLREVYPAFRLDDVEAACHEVNTFHAAGGDWIIDTMPTGAGRDAMMLREVSLRTGVPIVCPTGVHLAQYYEPDHPILRMDRRALSELFIREITIGTDDGQGIADVRAGVIKIAGGKDKLNAFQKEAFIAAAQAQTKTGCPIITHCEQGTAGTEQLSLLEKHGADLSHVILSHCDLVPDAAYHRELLSTGALLEYDQHFRQIERGEHCASVSLIAELAQAYPYQIVVGMDIARRRYWQSHGGAPGLAWLVAELPKRLAEQGLTGKQTHHILTDNPRHAFAFSLTHVPTHE